jgi:hypothetical protein
VHYAFWNRLDQEQDSAYGVAVGGEMHFQVWRFVDGEQYGEAMLDRLEVSEGSIVEVTWPPDEDGHFAVRGLREGEVDITVHDTSGHETSFVLPVRKPVRVDLNASCVGEGLPLLEGMRNIWLFSYKVYDRFDRPLSAKDIFPFTFTPADALASTSIQSMNSQWTNIVSVDVSGGAGMVRMDATLPGSENVTYEIVDEARIDAVDWRLTFPETVSRGWKNRVILSPEVEGKRICRYDAGTAPDFYLESLTPDICVPEEGPYTHHGFIEAKSTGTCEMMFQLPLAGSGAGIEDRLSFEVVL